MNRVPVQPDLLRWARERAGYSVDALAGRFHKLEEWERGEAQPTLKQLESSRRRPTRRWDSSSSMSHRSSGCRFLIFVLSPTLT